MNVLSNVSCIVVEQHIIIAFTYADSGGFPTYNASKKRAGFARKNTGTAALKAAAENSNWTRRKSVSGTNKPFIPPKQLLLYLVR